MVEVASELHELRDRGVVSQLGDVVLDLLDEPIDAGVPWPRRWRSSTVARCVALHIAVEEPRHPGDPLLAEVSAERVRAEVHHEKPQRCPRRTVSMYSSGFRTLPLLFDILAPSMNEHAVRAKSGVRLRRGDEIHVVQRRASRSARTAGAAPRVHCRRCTCSPGATCRSAPCRRGHRRSRSTDIGGGTRRSRGTCR